MQVNVVRKHSTQLEVSWEEGYLSLSGYIHIKKKSVADSLI